MAVGLIKWFDKQKGFGVIATSDSLHKEVFLHQSNFKDDLATLSEGVPLLFDIAQERGKTSAKGCRLLQNSLSDWTAVFKHVNTKASVSLKTKTVSFHQQALAHLDRGPEADLLQEALLSFVETEPESFYELCPFFHNREKSVMSSYRLKEAIREAFKRFHLTAPEEIRFAIWKQKQHTFLGLPKDAELTLSREQAFLHWEDLSLDDLKRLQLQEFGPEIIGFVLTNGREKLKQSFNERWFIICGNLLPMTNLTALKDEVAAELNQISKTQYLDFLLQEVERLVNGKDFMSSSSLGSMLSHFPGFLSEETIAFIKPILTERLLSVGSFPILLSLHKSGEITLPASSIISKVETISLKEIIAITSNPSLSFEEKYQIVESKVQQLESTFDVKLFEESTSLLPQFENTAYWTSLIERLNSYVPTYYTLHLEKKITQLGELKSFYAVNQAFTTYAALPSFLTEASKALLLEKGLAKIIHQCKTIEALSAVQHKGYTMDWSQIVKERVGDFSLAELLQLLGKDTSDPQTIEFIGKEKLKHLKKQFSTEEFEQFDKLISYPITDAVKTGFIEELNRLGETYFNESIKKCLAASSLVESELQLQSLVTKVKKIPSFLNSQFQEVADKLLVDHILNVATPYIVIIAWKKDYVSNIEEYLHKRKGTLNTQEVKEAVSAEALSFDLKLELLNAALTLEENCHWVLSLSKTYLPREHFDIFDSQAYELYAGETYFNLWLQKIGAIFPTAYLQSFFNSTEEPYKKVKEWIRDGICREDEIALFFLDRLAQNTPIEDRTDFYKACHTIETLISIGVAYVERIVALNNPFYHMILWFSEKHTAFDFAVLKGKFIYFKPEDQVDIVKRLFYLKHTKQFDFTIEQLDELTKADLDLYLLNEKFNSDFVLDVSTSVIIESLKAFMAKGKFLVESDLLKLVLHDTHNFKKRRFQLEHYFEECRGRMVAKWDWDTKGMKIFKKQYGEGQFYFAIQFSKYYDTNTGGHYGYNTQKNQNVNFDYLLQEVKKLPGCRWNAQEEHWGVSAKSAEEVLAFGRKHRFFIDLGSNNYSNNPHLARLSRSEVPRGIRFCDGNKSNKLDAQLQRAFWWCGNQPCLQNCITDHASQTLTVERGSSGDEELEDSKKQQSSGRGWKRYTLLDFIRIFELNVDSERAYGSLVEDGHYFQFISLVNRFNRLLKRLYCKACEDILYPVVASNFNAYTVTKFWCENKECGEHHQEVYLNHCLDGKCNSIIDSRESKTCEHGLYICSACGGCCSHEMFSRRLRSLEATGGYVHPQLPIRVQELDGHREREEYFCNKCGGIAAEVFEGADKYYECEKCSVKYHPDKSIKRTNRHLRRPNYPMVRKDASGGSYLL